MKILFLVLVCCLGAAAQSPSVLLFGRRVPCPDHTTYLLKQDFEGTGYDNCETWTETINNGKFDEDYTGLVLAGSQSLRMVDTIGTVDEVISSNIGTGTNGELWIYFMFRPVTIQVGNKPIISLRNTADSVSWQMSVNANGTIGMGSAAFVSSVGAMSAGTTYEFWLQFQTNTLFSCGFSSDGTKPTSGNNFIALNSGQMQGGSVKSVRIGDAGGVFLCEYVLDKFRATASNIGTNPP